MTESVTIAGKTAFDYGSNAGVVRARAVARNLCGEGGACYYQRRMAFAALVQLQTVPYKNNYYTEVTQMSAAPLYPVRPEVAATTLTDEATYKA
ncbi:MAG: hypothetical protein ACLGJA_25350, partial [Gammaproteobacteria bacterium]